MSCESNPGTAATRAVHEPSSLNYLGVGERLSTHTVRFRRCAENWTLLARWSPLSCRPIQAESRRIRAVSPDFRLRFRNMFLGVFTDMKRRIPDLTAMMVFQTFAHKSIRATDDLEIRI